MLGWWISVFSDADRQEPHLIASWECGVSGADWLDELCKEGRATQTENKGGYPDVYQTQARHVAPWLLGGKISPQGNAPHGNFTAVKSRRRAMRRMETSRLFLWKTTRAKPC